MFSVFLFMCNFEFTLPNWALKREFIAIGKPSCVLDLECFSCWFHCKKPLAHEREAKIIFSAINGFSHVVFITPTGMCAELLHVYFVSFHSLFHSTEYNVKHFSTTLVKTTIAAIPLTMKRLWESQNEIFQSTFFCLCVHETSIDERSTRGGSTSSAEQQAQFPINFQFSSALFTQQTHIWRKRRAKIRLKNLFIGNETASQHEILQLVREKQRLVEKVLSGIFLIHLERWWRTKEWRREEEN